MTEQEDYKQNLEGKIKVSLGMGWCGDLGDYADFVNNAITKHLYDVMNRDDTRFKPTFDQWENYKVNNENLVDMLYQLSEYQSNEDFRLTEIFETT